jgi:hypothetical protein
MVKANFLLFPDKHMKQRPEQRIEIIHQLIGDSIALGLPYSLAAAFAGITYQISMIG